jgi:hypothetical protein
VEFERPYFFLHEMSLLGRHLNLTLIDGIFGEIIANSFVENVFGAMKTKSFVVLIAGIALYDFAVPKKSAGRLYGARDSLR